jgi:hypothetical protein
MKSAWMPAMNGFQKYPGIRFAPANIFERPGPQQFVLIAAKIAQFRLHVK